MKSWETWCFSSVFRAFDELISTRCYELYVALVYVLPTKIHKFNRAPSYEPHHWSPNHKTKYFDLKRIASAVFQRRYFFERTVLCVGVVAPEFEIAMSIMRDMPGDVKCDVMCMFWRLAYNRKPFSSHEQILGKIFVIRRRLKFSG